MSPRAFFDLVTELRKAQKLYYTTPVSQYKTKQDALSRSKKLEKQIDDEIARVQRVLADKRQIAINFDG